MSDTQPMDWVKAMQKPLPKRSVWIAHEDPADKRGYEEIKKSVKAREVLYRHFSWPVASEKPEEVKRRSCVVSLCEMIHAVGDCFSVVLDYPSRAADGPEFSRLQQVPGVYFLTFDGCKYGESTRHRQCMITNMSCLLWLSRDCDHVTHPQSRHRCLNKPERLALIEETRCTRSRAGRAIASCARQMTIIVRIVHNCMGRRKRRRPS